MVEVSQVSREGHNPGVFKVPAVLAGTSCVTRLVHLHIYDGMPHCLGNMTL